MRTYVGAGWHIYTLTDRVVELRKEDHAFRVLTGGDGFVRVRVDPEMTREQAVTIAIETALKLDAKIAEMAALGILKSSRSINRYREVTDQLERLFAIPDEEDKRYHA